MPTIVVHLPPAAYRRVVAAARCAEVDPDTWASSVVTEAAAVTAEESLWDRPCDGSPPAWPRSGEGRLVPFGDRIGWPPLAQGRP